MCLLTACDQGRQGVRTGESTGAFATWRAERTHSLGLEQGLPCKCLPGFRFLHL